MNNLPTLRLQPFIVSPLKELKKLVNEMSLDDIEYYDGYKSSIAAKSQEEK